MLFGGRQVEIPLHVGGRRRDRFNLRGGRFRLPSGGCCRVRQGNLDFLCRRGEIAGARLDGIDRDQERRGLRAGYHELHAQFLAGFEDPGVIGEFGPGGEIGICRKTAQTKCDVLARQGRLGAYLQRDERIHISRGIVDVESRRRDGLPGLGSGVQLRLVTGARWLWRHVHNLTVLRAESRQEAADLVESGRGQLAVIGSIIDNGSAKGADGNGSNAGKDGIAYPEVISGLAPSPARRSFFDPACLGFIMSEIFRCLKSPCPERRELLIFMRLAHFRVAHIGLELAWPALLRPSDNFRRFRALLLIFDDRIFSLFLRWLALLILDHEPDRPFTFRWILLGFRLADLALLIGLHHQNSSHPAMFIEVRLTSFLQNLRGPDCRRLRSRHSSVQDRTEIRL